MSSRNWSRLDFGVPDRHSLSLCSEGGSDGMCATGNAKERKDKSYWLVLQSLRPPPPRTDGCVGIPCMDDGLRFPPGLWLSLPRHGAVSSGPAGRPAHPWWWTYAPPRYLALLMQDNALHASSSHPVPSREERRDIHLDKEKFSEVA